MRNSPWILMLGLLACDEPRDNNGGQFGEEVDGASCVEVERTPLAVDEVSALGFSAQEVLDWAEAAHAGTLTWADDTTTDATLTLSDPGEAAYVTYEVDPGDASGGEEPALGLECSPRVVLDVQAAFETADGAFAESWTETLSLDSASSLSIYRDLDEVSGSFDPLDWTTETYDEVWSSLLVELSAEGGMEGTVEGRGEKTHGTGPDGAVSLTMFEIATLQGGSAAEPD